VHYLAKQIGGELKAGEDVVEYQWFPINNLLECTENVKWVLEYYLKEEK
jgi:hypothetical protein